MGSVVISEMAWIVYMQILSECISYNVENMAFSLPLPLGEVGLMGMLMAVLWCPCKAKGSEEEE